MFRLVENPEFKRQDMLGMVAQAFNPSTWDAEAGGLLRV